MSLVLRHDLDCLLPPGGALAGRLFSRLIGDEPVDLPLAPGTRIGHWRIDRLLGCGGSAMVYLADRDDGHFEQQVALKVVRPNPRLIAQFRRERQILAELRHPGIARLIDGGEFDGGRLWFAMEAVFGERIDHHVRNRRLPLAERLMLFETACDAVAYAHRRQLIHRDIKPGNLLVDDTGWPCLLDFGIAISADDTDDAGHRAMTPIHASPEQLAGGVVTSASDIYQLGALLRTLVAPDGASCVTLPRKLSAMAAKRLNDIVAGATMIDPAKRYSEVAALCADVAAIRGRRSPWREGTRRTRFVRPTQGSVASI
jgi:serine/threonine protein kinase